MAIKRNIGYGGNYKISFLKKAKLGFTLIEIMLVILVVALLTLYAVRLINQSLLNSQVSRTASQINIIKQALTAFYTANDANWPNSINLLTQYISANTYNNLTSIPAMLPANGLCSSFSGNSPSCGSNAEFQGTAPGVSGISYYTISLPLPSMAIAQELTAVVPNSWTGTVESYPYLYVAIPPPAQISGGSNHGWIVSAGVISFSYKQGSNKLWNIGSGMVGTQVYLPNCGPGYEGHIIFSPERYETNNPGNDWGIHLAQVTPDGSKSDEMLTSCSSYPYATQVIICQIQNIQDAHGHFAYTTTYADSPDSSPSSVQHLAFYMTFCLPNGHWGTNWINSYWPQDAECSASWQTYFTKGGDPTPPTCSNTDAAGAESLSDIRPVGSPDAY